MKFLRLPLLLVVFTVIAACSSNPIRSDYDPTADFSQ